MAMTTNERAKKYADAHREEIRERARLKRLADPEYYRAQERARYAKNAEQIKARKLAEWHANEQRQIDRAIRRQNADHKAAGQAYAKRWRAAHPENVKASTQNRRARFLNAPGEFTKADVLRIYAAQGGECHWCKAPLNNRFDIDHIIPLSQGGSNFPVNICCACPTCNTAKGAKLPAEFQQYLAEVKGL